MRFAIAITISSFLLFQVQPILAKYVLPWFGGSISVWTTCMLFYQSLLLLGYAYAHWLTTIRSRKHQAVTHTVVVFSSLLFLPLVLGEGPRPQWSGTAEADILLFLLVTVGAPFLVLSSTGPLLQSWFAKARQGSSPYKLYALSNAASLAALLTYPTLVEPALDMTRQLEWWLAGYICFSGLIFACAWRVGAIKSDPVVQQENNPDAGVTPGRVCLWLVLALCASVVLLGATNHLVQELASVPLLWVLPLALYLLSFMLTFRRDHGYRRTIWLPALVVLLPLTGLAQIFGGVWPIALVIPLFCALVLVQCTVCHGELVRLKPAPEHLTVFYLAVAAGGAIGAVFVNLLSPILFDQFIELPLGLLSAHFTLIAILMRDGKSRLFRGKPLWVWGGLIVAGWGAGLPLLNLTASFHALDTSRSFYGAYEIKEAEDEDGSKWRIFNHGRTMHGLQFTDRDRRDQPTAYYGPDSGVGLTVRALHKIAGAQPTHMGVVGLGVGTLATYTRAGDHTRFYEIDPAMLELAEQYFTFLADSDGRISVVVGDGRLEIAREVQADTQPRLHLLVIDAFSSDAIPTHLLTAEAFEIYWRRLRLDGALVVNISNHYVDLTPVVRAAAERVGGQSYKLESDGDERQLYPSTWVLVTRNRRLIEQDPLRSGLHPWAQDAQPPVLWTDRYSNLFSVLKIW